MINKKLYVFNPDNDLALANGDENYMPPASARKMTADLALLPMWYAPSDSFVLASSAYNLSFRNEMKCSFISLPSLMTQPEVGMNTNISPVPWGWNVALRKSLYRLGISEEVLPELKELKQLRKLSHRLSAVDLLPELQLNASFCGFSVYLSSVNDLKTFIESCPEAILKAPWSGSGKGLCPIREVFSTSITNWCLRVIQQQGGVVAEPFYQKAEDFAMEFYSASGKVSFVGYSLFQTGTGGAYEGGLLLTNKEIEHRLSRYVSLMDLRTLRSLLEEKLSKMLGDVYAGYVGVDMMICSFAKEPSYRIHPCVEVNLRMNMGVVARTFYDRFVSLESEGLFRVEYFPLAGGALRRHEEWKQKYPAYISEGRLSKGYIPLTPVSKHTHYVAWALVD